MQQLMSFKTREENMSKIGQERSSMPQADNQYHRPSPWMQESVSTHKSPTPVRHSRMNQARSEEKEKERQERQRPGGWWKERQSNKAKTHLRSKNKAYLGTTSVNKVGREKWIKYTSITFQTNIRVSELGV